MRLALPYHNWRADKGRVCRESQILPGLRCIVCGRAGARTIAPQSKPCQPFSGWNDGVDRAGRLQRAKDGWIGRIHPPGQRAECGQDQAVFARHGAGAGNAAPLNTNPQFGMEMARNLGPFRSMLHGVGPRNVAQRHATDAQFIDKRAARRCERGNGRGRDGST